jgi:hypothetical protein
MHILPNIDEQINMKLLIVFIMHMLINWKYNKSNKGYSIFFPYYKVYLFFNDAFRIIRCISSLLLSN